MDVGRGVRGLVVARLAEGLASTALAQSLRHAVTAIHTTMSFPEKARPPRAFQERKLNRHFVFQALEPSHMKQGLSRLGLVASGTEYAYLDFASEVCSWH